MKKRFLSLSGLLMLSLSCLPLTGGAAVVLYTTQDDTLPQTDIPFEVVYLDAPERLLDETRHYRHNRTLLNLCSCVHRRFTISHG